MEENKDYVIKLAENCGFCFGVRRAVELVYDLRKKTGKKIYVIGELIHNGVFIKRLENDGIFCVDESEIEKLANGTEKAVFVIRTHGITKELNEKLIKNKFEILDCTCPFVKRIHKIVDENSDDADITLVIGDPKHPEVAGIKSYAKNVVEVCADDEECAKFVNTKQAKKDEILLLVSQTTGNNDKYVNCQKIIKKLYTKTKIFDTICNVTENRQNEVMRMAKESDVMCIIGGAKSSNTRKLYEIASKVCGAVYLVETADDLPYDDLKWQKEKFASSHKSAEGCRFTVGITAGASTPDDIIQEVKVRIEEILDSDEKQR